MYAIYIYLRMYVRIYIYHIYWFIVSTCFDSIWSPEVMVIVLTVVSYTLAPTRQAKSVRCQVFREGDWPACWRELRDVRFVQFRCMAVYGVHRTSLFHDPRELWSLEPNFLLDIVWTNCSRSRHKSSSLVWDIQRALQRCSKWPSLTASAGYLLRADEFHRFRKIQPNLGIVKI